MNYRERLPDIPFPTISGRLIGLLVVNPTVLGFVLQPNLQRWELSLVPCLWQGTEFRGSAEGASKQFKIISSELKILKAI